MDRTHIHFAAGLPGESGVISGMRRSCKVIYVRLVSATVLLLCGVRVVCGVGWVFGVSAPHFLKCFGVT